MDTHFIQLSLAILAAGFWVPVGLWLMLKRHALTVLATVPVEARQELPRVSIVIPARNEERNLEQALQSVLSLDYPGLEIVAVNDRSTDGTGAILETWAKRETRLTVLTVETLPAGWVGKTYALHTGARQARGDYVLFTDADVVFHPSVLRRAVNYMQTHQVDHLTAIPEVTVPGILLNALCATFTIVMCIVFAPWNARNPRSRSYVGIGAFNFIRRSVYQEIGGHTSIALRPDDDVKFGKLVKSRGYQQDVVNGRGTLAVEWYRSLPEFINGLTKNMFSGVEYRVSWVVLVNVGSLLVNIWPWVGVWFTTGLSQALLAGAVVMMVTSFGVAGIPFGVKPWHGLLLPVTFNLLAYVQCRAMALTLLQGGIYWRGTFYSLRELKAKTVEKGHQDAR